MFTLIVENPSIQVAECDSIGKYRVMFFNVNLVIYSYSPIMRSEKGTRDRGSVSMQLMRELLGYSGIYRILFFRPSTT